MSEMPEIEADTLRARRMKLQQDRQLIQQQLAARRAARACGGGPQLERSLRRLLQYRERERETQARAMQKRFQLFAYNLYCSKPQIYRHLKALLQLPNQSFFRNYKLYLAPEFEECILYFLSSKLNSLRSEVNHFVLCLDQQPLNRNYVYDTKRDVILGLHNVNGVVANRPASMAYVMMLRNLCIDWVQPVAYAFRSVCLTNSSQVSVWCTQVLSKLLEIGIQVEAVITRPDTISQAGYNSNDGNRTNYKFRGTPAYHLHDVRLLIEGVRNCLINNDFYYNESRISWHYIKLLYYHQRDSDSELIPNIKEVHMHPSSGQGSQWKHAKEIFSFEVYDALEQLMAAGALPHEARPTASFVRAMSELLGVVSPGRRPSGAGRVRVLERAAAMFRNICLRAGDVPAPVSHMAVALGALATMLPNLAEKGLDTVCTSRLNNAPVHAFFRAVPRTARPGRRLKPTASQVYSAFADAFARAMRRRSRWARREELAEAAGAGLLDPRRVPAGALALRPAPRRPAGADLRQPLPRAGGAEASWLLHHCLRVHSCPQLDKSLAPRRPLLYKAPEAKVPDSSRELWERLLEPPGVFVRHVQELKEQLAIQLKLHLFRSPGAAALRELARRPAAGLPCACFPRRRMLRLLVRRLLWQARRQCNQRLRLQGPPGRVSGFSFQVQAKNR